jgi:uncharacterized protein DUF5655
MPRRTPNRQTTGDSLWRCPNCKRVFANRNQTHTCAGLHDLDHHFANRDPIVREIYERVATAVKAIGPVIILPEKTRIAFQVRMSFAQVTPRQKWLDGHVVLARRLDHPRFRKIETFSPKNHLHAFRLEHPDDVDETFISWMREAYQVGDQKHLRSER